MEEHKDLHCLNRINYLPFLYVCISNKSITSTSFYNKGLLTWPLSQIIFPAYINYSQAVPRVRFGHCTLGIQFGGGKWVSLLHRLIKCDSQRIPILNTMNSNAKKPSSQRNNYNEPFLTTIPKRIEYSIEINHNNPHGHREPN